MDMTAQREKLQQQLATARARLQRIEKDAARSHSSDSAEQAQERENDEVIDSLGLETRAVIEATLDALRQIEAGSYGTCSRCGEDIGEARLAAIPQATTCISCAE